MSIDNKLLNIINAKENIKNAINNSQVIIVDNLFEDYPNAIKYLNSYIHRSDFAVTSSDAFFLRQTAEGAHIFNGAYARINKIGGNSRVFNQLLMNDMLTETKNGITFTNNGNGTFTVNGTANKTTYFRVEQRGNNTVIPGHKYLLKGGENVDGSANNTYELMDSWNGRVASSKINPKPIATIPIDATDSQLKMQICVKISSGVTISNKIFKPQLFNLTLMELDYINTLEEFNDLFPNDYYSYNEGEIQSCNPTKLISTGANFINFDSDKTINTKTAIESQAKIDYDIFYNFAPNNYQNSSRNTIVKNENGSYTITLVSASNGGYGLGFKMRVLPDTWYYIKEDRNDEITYVYPNDNNTKVGFFTQTGEYISNFAIAQNNPTKRFKAPDNAYYAILVIRANSGVPCTINNLMVSTFQSDDYEEYKESVFNIPQNLPLNSAGNVRDEFDFDNRRHIQRVGVVDLGALNWDKNSDPLTSHFYATPTIAGKGFGSWEIPNIICAKYITQMSGDVMYHTKDKCIALDSTGKIIIYDSELENLDVVSFKTAVQGVMVYYELNEPIITDLSSVITDNRIKSYRNGTEYFDSDVPTYMEATYLLDKGVD